jgi:hypothetical protein
VKRFVGRPGAGAATEAAARVAPELAPLSRERLLTMLDAGRAVRVAADMLARTGDNAVSEVLRGQGPFYEWDHYPKGDVYDHVTHAQFYYHAHPPAERPGEHGHFHTFLRPRGMPPGIAPAPVPDAPAAADPDAALCHLVAIGMDFDGRPVSLFATNRWVTGETWYRAEDAIRMLDFFAVDHARPSWPVNRWITSLVALFKPTIEDLLRRRDAAVADFAAAHPGENAYEARALNVLAEAPIAVERQIAAVEAALAALPQA